MFLSTKGMGENLLPESNASGAYTGPFTFNGFASPLAQSGDFPFEAFSGAITDFYPESSVGSLDRPGVVNFISARDDNQVTDVFSFYDQQAAGKGTVVYLGGHDYSVGGGLQDTVGITAGSRLVLNTLFSLSTSEACHP